MLLDINEQHTPTSSEALIAKEQLKELRGNLELLQATAKGVSGILENESSSADALHWPEQKVPA